MKWELCVENASLIGPRVSNGVPRLNRSLWNAATVAHRRRPIYYPTRARTVWIAVKARRRREGRSGIPDARVSTSLSLRPSTPRMQDSGVRFAYQSDHFYVERVVSFSFFFSIKHLEPFWPSWSCRNCFANGCAILKHVFFYFFSVYLQ